jgi:hypothetical protein
MPTAIPAFLLPVLLLCSPAPAHIPAPDLGPPLGQLCPLVRAGTRIVCRLPADTCVSGLVTSYAACISDTASDGSSGQVTDIGRSTPFGAFRPVGMPCLEEVAVYRCSCTPLGDYCAPGSICQRTAVLDGTVIPAGGYVHLVPCSLEPDPGQSGELAGEP